MSVSSIAPISIPELEAVYSSRNLATAGAFAAAVPLTRPSAKDIRSEDAAINASLKDRLHEAERIYATSATGTKNNESDDQRRRNRKGVMAKFADKLEDEQESIIDSYA